MGRRRRALAGALALPASMATFCKMTATMMDMSKQSLLIGALAVVVICSFEESIKTYTLSIFTQMAHRRPEVLLLLYDHLLEYLDDVLINSHNPMLFKEASVLLCVTSSDEGFGKRADRERSWQTCWRGGDSAACGQRRLQAGEGVGEGVCRIGG